VYHTVYMFVGPFPSVGDDSPLHSSLKGSNHLWCVCLVIQVKHLHAAGQSALADLTIRYLCQELPSLLAMWMIASDAGRPNSDRAVAEHAAPQQGAK
jgi:hypothetical protein